MNFYPLDLEKTHTLEGLGKTELAKGRGKFAIEKVSAIKEVHWSKAAKKAETMIFSGEEKILRKLDNILIYWDCLANVFNAGWKE